MPQLSEETCLHRRMIRSGTPCRYFGALPTSNMMNGAFFKGSQLLLGFLHCDYPFISIWYSQQYMGLSSAWKKKEISVLRGSTSLSIVLLLTRLPLIQVSRQIQMHFSHLSSIIPLVLGVFHVVNAASIKRIQNPACAALVPIVQQIQNDLFDGGECGDEALSALRLVFHDAMGFSIHGGKGGGADGSILIFNETENAFPANVGIEDITSLQFPVFQETGLSAGDFIHLAAAIGTANCPGAPSLKFYYGRPPPVAPAPDHTVPGPADNVTSIIERFADAGFTVPEVIALLVSHTIAAADVVDPTIPGTPLDSTVGIFDTQFFLEVLLKGTSFPGNGSRPLEALSPIQGEMRLQSDFLLARDPRTACYWQDMIDNQAHATRSFKAAMAKLQLLGQNVTELIDCSEVIPTAAPFNSHIKYPASFSEADVEISCQSRPFPRLATVAGPAPSLLPIPVASIP